MDVECSLCGVESSLDEITIDNNLEADKNKEILEALHETFGIKKIDALTACNKCISSLRTLHSFKQTVSKQHQNLKRIANIQKPIDDFISSNNEEIITHTHDGIMLLVPVSKRYKIAEYKYLSGLYSAKISILKLPVTIYPDDEDDEAECHETHLNNNNLTQNMENSPFALVTQEIERSIRSANISQDELSQIFNDDLPDTSDDSMSDMDISGIEQELHPIKLEPNIQIEDYESNLKNSKKPNEFEKEWIYSNISKKCLRKRQKNGKYETFKCLICNKKTLSRHGAYSHVLNFHFKTNIKKNINSVSLIDSSLTPDEMKFIKENSNTFKREAIKGGKCKICNASFKRFAECKKHMIVHHLKKSLTEISYEAMRNKLCTLGRVNKQFQCIICRDNENLLIFNNRTKILKHLRLHSKEDIKNYSNEENREIISPEDASYNHTVMQIKSELN